MIAIRKRQTPKTMVAAGKLVGAGNTIMEFFIAMAHQSSRASNLVSVPLKIFEGSGQEGEEKVVDHSIKPPGKSL
jgi:hypothetical protein